MIWNWKESHFFGGIQIVGNCILNVLRIHLSLYISKVFLGAKDFVCKQLGTSMTQMVQEEVALGETCILYVVSWFMIRIDGYGLAFFSPENLQVKNTHLPNGLFPQILKIRSWDFPEPPPKSKPVGRISRKHSTLVPEPWWRYSLNLDAFAFAICTLEVGFFAIWCGRWCGLRLPNHVLIWQVTGGRMLLVFFLGQNHAEEWRKNDKIHGISFFGRLMIPSWFSRWTCYLKIIFLDQFSTEPEPYQPGTDDDILDHWSSSTQQGFSKNWWKWTGNVHQPARSTKMSTQHDVTHERVRWQGGKVEGGNIHNLQIPNSEISHSFILEK